MKFKTTEFTLGEAILTKRISDGDLSAVAELLKSRAEEEFDPLPLPISEVTRLLQQLSEVAREYNDEVGAFIAKLK